MKKIRVDRQRTFYTAGSLLDITGAWAWRIANIGATNITVDGEVIAAGNEITSPVGTSPGCFYEGSIRLEVPPGGSVLFERHLAIEVTQP